MSKDGNIRGDGEHRRYGVIGAFAAAALTVIAAVIGLVTVLVDDGGSGTPAQSPPALTETSEADSHETTTKRSAERNGEGSLDPAHSGNSRASAKRLPGDRPVYSSLVAGNDEDWYVYEAQKDETATVEVATAGEEADTRIISASLFEGHEEIDSEEDASAGIPFVAPRLVAAGVRLFVYVRDSCGDLGCSIGPYRVVVRTSPPG